MAKKIILVVAIGAICCLPYLYVNNYMMPFKSTNESVDTSKLFHAKMSFYANSLDEVYEQSSIVIEATIEDKTSEIEFGPGFYFTFTEAKVNDVIKGTGLSENDKINIIQTKYLIEDPILEKGSKKILFLIKYDNKEYADNDYTYACVGGYQGIYDISDDGTVTNSLKSEDLPPIINGNDNINKSIYDETENMLKDFAGGKHKNEFISEIKDLD